MREPVVAGRFYPANKHELEAVIDDYTKEALNKPPVKAIGVIAPHAGYVYSGKLAANTLHSVYVPKTVILIGPNHTGQGHPASLSTENWSTPLGEVPANTELIQHLINQNKTIVIDESAHSHEHCLEVQIPFLQRLQPNLSIVPLILGHLSYDTCEDIAESLFRSIEEYPGDILILASTDMNHYESRSVSQVKDKLALNAIEKMDPYDLYSTVHKNKISMCGVIPVVVTLLTSIKLGAKRTTLLSHIDSGDVSGDTNQVVGYAGVIIQ